MASIEISIVIISHHAKESLRERLKTVLIVAKESSAEIIVADNVSQDGFL